MHKYAHSAAFNPFSDCFWNIKTLPNKFMCSLVYMMPCVLCTASKQQLDAIFNDPGHPLHVGHPSDLALCLLVYYLLLFLLCFAGHLSQILCCCYLLGFLWWLMRLRNGRIERSIRASMNYNTFVDSQFVLAHLSHPGRDVCVLSRTIYLRSHKSCHALKTRRIPDQWNGV